MISHRNFGTMQRILREHYLAQVYARMEPPYDDGGGAAETELLLLPFFHCYGFGMLANCLLRGATGVLMARFEPELFCRSVQDFKVIFSMKRQYDGVTTIADGTIADEEGPSSQIFVYGFHIIIRFLFT
jgi:acyl-CoA synthetase (AMP-forming)/AMP-acid ligase II